MAKTVVLSWKYIAVTEKVRKECLSLAPPWLSPSGQVNFLVLWFHNDPGLSSKVWEIRLGYTCAYIGHRIPVLPQIEVLGNMPSLPTSL